MRERVAALGGSVWVTAGDGARGTRVTVTLPLPVHGAVTGLGALGPAAKHRVGR